MKMSDLRKAVSAQVFLMLLLSMLLLLGCQSGPDVDELKAEAIETYANIVFANYEDSYETVRTLQEKVEAFVENPSEETMAAAKEAWLASREPYGQTEAYRFYGGAIDNEDGPEPLLNAWPLDEVYIDYVEGNDTAGIINDVENYPTIDKALLVSLNEAGAEENISVGYHAIEFLLWGQDAGADSAGVRAYTDYLVGGTAANQERRAQYLLMTTQLLVLHLGEMKDQWDPNQSGNYRAEFVALAADDVIQKMMTGIGVLSKSELAGERLFTAYDNQDQEDEHSCFSDNTHRDIINNAQGIRNVYMGEYTRPDDSRLSGTSLGDVVAAVNPELHEEIIALLDSSLEAANAIHVPFDQAIVLADHRPAVLNTVQTLQKLGDKFAEAATALGISVNTALPE